MTFKLISSGCYAAHITVCLCVCHLSCLVLQTLQGHRKLESSIREAGISYVTLRSGDQRWRSHSAHCCPCVCRFGFLTWERMIVEIRVWCTLFNEQWVNEIAMYRWNLEIFRRMHIVLFHLNVLSISKRLSPKIMTIILTIIIIIICTFLSCQKVTTWDFHHCVVVQTSTCSRVFIQRNF